MENVPIQFEYGGNNHAGYFQKVAGAGSSAVWHLFDEQHYYAGRLRFTDQWVFDPTQKTKELVSQADYFAEYLIAWFE